MCERYLGFVLLAWLPGLLHAQTAKLSCTPPELTDGYFVPQQETYSHGKMLTYGCETGFKPVLEGWWATSTCQNGKWSHTPQCIDSGSCLPPTIPNGKYEEAQNGWYEENHRITVTCEDGYELKRRTNTALCLEGRWSPLPLCEKSINACDEPDKIPHGVIISQAPKEVYGHNSQLEYACEDGYSTGQANNRKSITCQNKIWTPQPSCILLSPSCVIEPSHFKINQTSRINFMEGETKTFNCIWDNFKISARCYNRRIEVTQCCRVSDINRGLCGFP